MLKILVALVALIGLHGCAGPQIANLSLSDIQSLRIETVEVTADPSGTIWWGRAEREYAEKVASAAVSKPASKAKHDEPADPAAAHAAIVESPEGKAYLRQRISEMMAAQLRKDVVPQYQGARKVALVVTVKSMIIPSPAQRILIGGAPSIVGTAKIVDLTTKAVLASTPDNAPLLAAAPAGNGVLGVLADQAFSDLEDRLLTRFAKLIKAWLPLSGPGSQANAAL